MQFEQDLGTQLALYLSCSWDPLCRWFSSTSYVPIRPYFARAKLGQWNPFGSTRQPFLNRMSPSRYIARTWLGQRQPSWLLRQPFLPLPSQWSKVERHVRPATFMVNLLSFQGVCLFMRQVGIYQLWWYSVLNRWTSKLFRTLWITHPSYHFANQRLMPVIILNVFCTFIITIALLDLPNLISEASVRFLNDST